MTLKPQSWYNQSAVIPYRRDSGKLRILLVTSRSRKRWVVPKGIIDPGLSPQESAVNEAYEEAGIKGIIGTDTIGKYRYEKWGGICSVSVFPFEVTEVLDDWPECDIRQRKWITVSEAADLVREEDLKQIIRKIPELV